LQDALINVSFLIITVIVNQMGVIASASLGVVEKIIVFAMLPPMAISSAVATMTAQNYGAGLIQRMNKCLASGIGIALGLCVFPITAGDAYRILFQRCGGSGNGGGVFAGV
jgi:Na+-driven multidrug efflux pump